ncbi:MAG: precorrin-4 C(11)-methyltransferase [Synergistaceae bacterium]|jgi:precorrin-4/cobalt-precorrin-4 C11-methyltransferase|nr:precorrin-4 C(11)-methyltransferase [Synergistaceae bacterium]
MTSSPGELGKLGKVYIVGAGPGDPELITVKGAKLLEMADFIVYAGSLVNAEILRLARPDCVTADSSGMTLEEQVSAMTEALARGLVVVRLHTGDPSLYGAISEQIAALERNNIECEIIPGVSSLQGAAARLGVEYTVPGGSQTLICTRMTGRTPTPEAESIGSLASHGSTIALFLSADRAQEVVSACIAAGRSPDTPAAWIYRATWPDEKMAISTLSGLAASLREAGITKHALLIIGDCLGKDSSSRSMLYDPNFSHGAREAQI